MKRSVDDFFKSLAAAGAGGIVVSITAVAIAAIRTPELREVPWGQINWASLWEHTKESPVFLLLVIAVCVSAFYWEYRRATRAE